MTYRRLFLWILAGSVLVLLALVLLSRQHIYQLSHARKGGTDAHLSLVYSTLSVRTHTPAPSWMDLTVTSIGIPKGARRELAEEYGLAGKFRNDKAEIVMDPTRTIHTRKLEIPIWVPWLLFVAICFCLTRFMEKRALAKHPHP